MKNTPLKNEIMQRFELHVDGKIAVLEYHEQEDDTVVFTHTFVPPALRGHTLAAVLTEFALEDARIRGKKVIPQCSYVARYLQRNKKDTE